MAARDERRSWTVLADVVAALRKRWERGDLLSALASGELWEPLSVPLRGPSAGEAGERFEEVREWVRGWQAIPAARARVEFAPIGGRAIGANQIPARVWFDTREQLWSLLGVRRDVDRFQALHAAASEFPAVATWMAARPMRVLAQADVWPQLIRTVEWIARKQDPDRYLRQIDVPGVDTKFIETHRGVLADLLDVVLAAERVRQEHPRSAFAARYGFAQKPEYVRFRSLGGAPVAGLFSEATVRVEELAVAPVPVDGASTVIVVENEITYLALPSMTAALAILGGGYAVERLSRLGWLADREIVYWGDIDTHGFTILDRLRRRFPDTRSVLMDRRTLMAHET